MKGNRAILWLAGVLALGVLVGPLAGEALADKKVTFVMSWVPDSRWASEMVAQYRGYFKAEGLEVTLKWTKGGRSAAKETAAGAADFGAIAGSDVLPSREKDIPLVSIASTLSKTGISFISLPKAGIRAPKDFMGKKVGVERGSTTWVGFLALMNKYGVDVDKLEKIEVGFGLKALLAGVVDVRPAMYHNEVVLAEHQGIPLNVIWLPEHGIELVGTGIVTTEQMLKKDPDMIRAYIRAVLKGYQHAKGDPEDAIKALIQYQPDQDPVYQRKVLKVLFDKIAVPAKNGLYGWADRDEWNDTQENLIKFDIMKKRVKLDDAFTNRFVADYYGKKAE